MLLARGFGAPYVPKATPKEPGYRLIDVQAIEKAILERSERANKIRHSAFAAKLPTCPTSAIVNNKWCYGGYESVIKPLGTFYVYGVLFHVNEFRKTEHFTFLKTITPDDAQSVFIERAIRKRSKQLFDRELKRQPKNLSLRQARSLIHGFQTRVLGLKYNPIAPTTDENEKEYGLKKWLERGGFPLMSGVVTGAISLDEAIIPVICQSVYCRCPISHPSPAIKSNVSCIQGRIAKDGTLKQHPGNDGASFWVHFNVERTGRITVALDYDEPSKLERFANGMASIIEKLGTVLCGAAPIAKEQLTELTAPICTDKNNQPCKQSASGCQCVAPPDSTIAAVNATNMYMSTWCDGWLKQMAPPKDFPIEDLSPPPEPEKNYLPWIIGGLAIAGAFAFASRK